MSDSATWTPSSTCYCNVLRAISVDQIRTLQLKTRNMWNKDGIPLFAELDRLQFQCYEKEICYYKNYSHFKKWGYVGELR